MFKLYPRTIFTKGELQIMDDQDIEILKSVSTSSEVFSMFKDRFIYTNLDASDFEDVVLFKWEHKSYIDKCGSTYRIVIFIVSEVDRDGNTTEMTITDFKFPNPLNDSFIRPDDGESAFKKYNRCYETNYHPCDLDKMTNLTKDMGIGYEGPFWRDILYAYYNYRKKKANCEFLSKHDFLRYMHHSDGKLASLRVQIDNELIKDLSEVHYGDNWPEKYLLSRFNNSNMFNEIGFGKDLEENYTYNFGCPSDWTDFAYRPSDCKYFTVEGMEFVEFNDLKEEIAKIGGMVFFNWLVMNSDGLLYCSKDELKRLFEWRKYFNMIEGLDCE